MLCYPAELSSDCYYFKESNHPFGAGARAGVEIFYDPLPHALEDPDRKLSGLASDSSGLTWTDGDVGSDAWFWAVGARSGEANKVPAVQTTDSTYRLAKIVLFYVFKY